MKFLEVFGVIFLGALLVLPFVSFVSAGEFNFLLEEQDQNVTQHNQEIPTNWFHSGTKEVQLNSTYFVSPLGQLVDSLDAGVIYTVEHDGNLLVDIKGFDESACSLFLDLDGVAFEVDSQELKVLPVSVGDKFGVKFTVTGLDSNCAMNFDLNKQWVE